MTGPDVSKSFKVTMASLDRSRDALTVLKEILGTKMAARKLDAKRKSLQKTLDALRAGGDGNGNAFGVYASAVELEAKARRLEAEATALKDGQLLKKPNLLARFEPKSGPSAAWVGVPLGVLTLIGSGVAAFFAVN